MSHSPQTRPFSDVVRDLAGGHTNVELTEALQQLVATVRDTGRAGEITLKIKVRQAKGTDTCIQVDDSFTLKLPELDRPTTILFADQNNGLVRDDPDQKTINLESVDTETGEVIQLDDQAAAN